MAAPAVILFDLGGVLLPFDRERRVAVAACQLGVHPAAVRALFAGELPGRMDLGAASEADFADAFAGLAGRPVSEDEARALLLSVFEPPNAELWALADVLRGRVGVGGFSDNPAFVRAVFPPGAILDPMIFSSEIGAAKPSEAAFAAAEARAGAAGADIVFVDDMPANVEAARRRGWDAILYRSNAELTTELGRRGLP
jgi:HAD superfamily hydrolase (TIGR01509 family)